MENKDIILFILAIIVLYLLFCDNKKNKEIEELKEKFSVTTSTISSKDDKMEIFIKDKVDKYLNNKKDIPISESIKNLGILAKALQNDKEVTVPGNLRVLGELNTNADKNQQYGPFKVYDNGSATFTHNNKTLFTIDSNNNLVFDKFRIDENGILFNDNELNMTKDGIQFGETKIDKYGIKADVVETSILRPKIRNTTALNKQQVHDILLTIDIKDNVRSDEFKIL